ncbi:MAG: UDP-N-acetylmuramate dehydrogenase [bacterium]|nr:UDP-N-acetylmuramate dehydrogenase [bacterium]
MAKIIKLRRNVDLTGYNSLRVQAKAKYFLDADSTRQLTQLPSEPVFILGQGCNTLFTRDFAGLIIKTNFKGRQVIAQKGNNVMVEIAAGEDWPQTIAWTVAQNWAGLENLALIPGSVGSAPIQNIGAYGQSLDEVFHALHAVELASGKTRVFSKKECRFLYRDSIFKHELKDKYLVTALTLKLITHLQQPTTSYYSRYESLATELTKLAARPPYTVKDIFRAVISLRTQKLPDWRKTGTAGSFFKNPFVTKTKLAQLQDRVPKLQYYPTTGMDYPQLDDPTFDHSQYFKIPAGRLLDELGWRGKTIGRVSTFAKHALVVINLGGATGREIYAYTEKMRADVKKSFDIDLEYEVNII